LLFLLSGSSGSGKSAALQRLERLQPDLELLDLDAVFADETDRHFWNQTVELSVQRALAAGRSGHDAVLAGWTPLGELLAAPSATKLEGIAACHLDCDDEVRVERLRARGREWGLPSDELLAEILRFSEYLRGHYADPAWHRPDERPNAWPEMRWERWAAWERGDPRWSTLRIDTTSLTPDEVADRLASWIAEQRELRRRGVLPLSGDWWD
jgi:hypothetical protein